jgi:hypothetical protein
LRRQRSSKANDVHKRFDQENLRTQEGRSGVGSEYK